MRNKLLVLLVLLSSLAGCRSYVPLAEQVPSVPYKASQRVAMSVIDSRDYLRNDQRAYAGTTIVAFGIPAARNISFLTGNGADDQLMLAGYLGERARLGATKAGWDVSFVDLLQLPGPAEADGLMAAQKAAKLVVFDVHEWFFRINLAGFNGIYSTDSFDFNHKTDIFVYEPGGGSPFRLTVGEDELLSLEPVKGPDMHLRDFPNLFVYAFRNQLGKLLANAELRKRLAE